MYCARREGIGGFDLCRGRLIAARIKIIDKESKRTVETTVGLLEAGSKTDLGIGLKTVWKV